MGTIRFEIRKDKVNKQGKSPIRLIYQMHGVRRYFDTGIKVRLLYWDQETEKVVYNKRGELTDKHVDTLNQRFNEIEAKVLDIENTFEADGIKPTPDMVIRSLSDLSDCDSLEFVYLMINKATGRYKIGLSKDPVFREKTLMSEEPDIKLLYQWPGSRECEKYLHDQYRRCRLRGEWFSLTEKQVAEICIRMWLITKDVKQYDAEIA